jgi:peptidyl-prolyl cis-trans isomerase B (cyclophilin B)
MEGIKKRSGSFGPFRGRIERKSLEAPLLIRALVLPFALALSLFGQTPAPTPALAPAPAPVAKGKPRVKLTTNYGVIVLELDPEAAPKTVANFLRYVEEGHYKGTIFHRVIPDFMIQGGGMNEDLVEKPTHDPIVNEAPLSIKMGLKNERGTVAMARVSEPHSAGAQFYINAGDNRGSLDHKSMNDEGYGYCVFGRVIEGMETVDKITKVRTEFRKGFQNVPEYGVRIRGAELLKDAPAN